ncbi:hypothetical protein GOBAR_AA18529 [Gossypium barbadense]|uniref:Uncharacterized protein n=1 Tax=Gossypium barbadense TaxID=3634 RepID=A0A2P5XFM9_GOSBA|nr:hypothetical protein GOBAR_AA18529 [Gossypium barbadense]
MLHKSCPASGHDQTEAATGEDDSPTAPCPVSDMQPTTQASYDSSLSPTALDGNQRHWYLPDSVGNNKVRNRSMGAINAGQLLDFTSKTIA